MTDSSVPITLILFKLFSSVLLLIISAGALISSAASETGQPASSALTAPHAAPPADPAERPGTPFTLDTGKRFDALRSALPQGQE